MRSRFYLLGFVLLLAQVGIAQTARLLGKIVDETTNEPLAFASIYYNNTTIGTQSDINGKFSIPYKGLNVEMVVSYVGYETINFPIGERYDGKIMVFKMRHLARSMQEFEVSSKRGKSWYNNFELFKKKAIGVGLFANNCKILNPEALQFSYDTATLTMRASADEMLKIEHQAFGFLINYSLSQFEYNILTRVFIIKGFPFFEKMTGSPAQERRWRNNQKLAYEGSMLHFVHSIHNRSLKQEGFELNWVERKPNPVFVEDPKIKKAVNALKRQTLYEASQPTNTHQQTISRADQDRFVEFVDTSSVTYEDFLVEEDSTMYLQFRNYLQVKYVMAGHTWVSNQSGPKSSLVYLSKERVALDPSGRVLEPDMMMLEGYWATQLLGDLLPFDYLPQKEKD
ncbi:MAG TPA: carboxypeptidase-like regulatory domain-containing protein [Haliscomenobacter sp.]|uniref:carboxypeptidase-like regulatory domain-containing protein n=1 Tax=Haliscomenobacter sp. TaxID=2717303 RepID=UPI002C6D9FDC|nr:carboxypeptidase-like regulatory domain-containing protein [Haliscomenobacter sp.]HOY16526.1 carboxypeptidase-like regulatory domain-containing protein [Haliscomenobacter sp.]